MSGCTGGAQERGAGIPTASLERRIGRGNDVEREDDRGEGGGCAEGEI
jgi:hypothetical protein